MVDIGSYQVQIRTKTDGEQEAILSPATAVDMPINWTCSWPDIWQNTEFDLENIIKLEYQQQVWGLMRYTLYPYPGSPETLEIENLEANPASAGTKSNRLIEPIGKWLVWYATQIGLRYCSGGVSDTLILLKSLDSAFDYYRDTIEMDYVGATNLAPGEDGYVFKFSREQAADFCRRQEQEWRSPIPLDP
ncbi:hypothetical protein [Kamptonema sp. UHCC 0994]|uniref:hypothetical protein n=1 Tax=Kamptonema sp. UHCC 0994 TaxID=3031329 RepID=UPI0023B8E899|nr:hypothetical protein [Kamptonema sp. UHCC 0994]MDF0555449.1 hypothetical protein [Kamptonema sp. UHCC 0994]